MKFNFLPLALAAAVAGFLVHPAQASPSQYVVLVSEGLSPKVVELGKSYIRKADDDPEATTSFDEVTDKGKPAPALGFSDLKGVLSTASQHGFKTGLVTTGSALSDAALLFGTETNAEAVLSAPFSILAGGGRTQFQPAQLNTFTAAGNTYITNEGEIDAEIKGRALLLQSATDLSFSLDRDPESEAGLGELAALAIDKLSVNNAPFVLIVHDTLIKKALDTKDSPALFEQFREDSGILLDVLTRRDENPGLAVAAMWTGGTTPRFTTTVDSEISNAFFVLAKLGASYCGTNEALKDADAEKIASFVDPEDGVYRGWKLSAGDKAAIISGKVKPETLARRSYEPIVKLAFDGEPQVSGAVTLGFEAPQGLGSALLKAVSQTAK